MHVRAKLYVSKVERNAYDPDAVTVTLQAVTRGEENREWAAATPTANFTATIKNPDAARPFVEGLGKEFFVEIFPVDDTA